MVFFSLLFVVAVSWASSQNKLCSDPGMIHGPNEICAGGNCFVAYCDQNTEDGDELKSSSNGGGWMVFQRRYDGTMDFRKSWFEYKYGFGSITTEHWLGFNRLMSVMNLPGLEFDLRIELGAHFYNPTNPDRTSLNLLGKKRVALYNGFKLIGSKYQLYVRNYDYAAQHPSISAGRSVGRARGG